MWESPISQDEVEAIQNDFEERIAGKKDLPPMGLGTDWVTRKISLASAFVFDRP